MRQQAVREAAVVGSWWARRGYVVYAISGLEVVSLPYGQITRLYIMDVVIALEESLIRGLDLGAGGHEETVCRNLAGLRGGRSACRICI